MKTCIDMHLSTIRVNVLRIYRHDHGAFPARTCNNSVYYTFTTDYHIKVSLSSRFDFIVCMIIVLNMSLTITI